MGIIVVVFLVFIIVGLIVWIKNLKKSLREHFVIEHELQYEVGHDELTGLVNGSLAIDRLSQSIKNAQRYDNKIAVLYIGIEYSKQINSSMCFDINNEFLRLFAQRLVHHTKKEDTVAFVSDHEFLILLEDRDKSLDIKNFADKLIDISKDVFAVQHHKINVFQSIGISVYPNDNVDTMTLLSHAATAMQMVKEEGGNSYKFYTPAMAEEAFLNGKLEEELVESIKNKQMQINYQIQIDSEDRKIFGVEALARWEHPMMGKCTSEQFISLAEEIGFIVDIDKAVVNEAFAQCKKWYENSIEFKRLSLNISTQSLLQDNFVSEIRKVIDENPFLRDALIFEIKEKELMQKPNWYIEKMKDLEKMGIKFAIENFGIYPTQLQYLEKLPIDSIKIDRSIVANIQKNKKIIKTIIAIAQSMDIKIMAECVDSDEQCEFLSENASIRMQGYFFHKPMSADKVEEELKALSTS